MQQSGFSLQNVIEQVSQEKGIDPKILVEAMEQAILTAAKRTFGLNRELEARYNEETGAVDLFQYMTVSAEVEDSEREISTDDASRVGLESEVGEELGFQVFYMPDDADRAREQDREFGDLLQMRQHRRGFGRIAAQTAKQVIIQRVRDAERDRIHDEYKDRKGEVITGVVRRFERGNNIIVDLGRNVEAVLGPKEQTPRENYRPGDRIVALLKDIDREARGPQLMLSRTHVDLLVKLFEMEVPEIYEGIVRIVSAAREPGARSKIGVSSRDTDVDPVGACVGMKGSRVQAVVQELRGEKIDIVPWDRDPARFVCNAIAPAEVVRVVIDEANTAMELVVPDAKLSLAIGRRGQNVRLASQLTGWRLDIVSESRFKLMEEEALAAFGRIEGSDEEFAKRLYKAGFRSLEEVANAPTSELVEVTGVSEAEVDAVRSHAIEATEAIRQDRLRAAVTSEELLGDHEILTLVQGVNRRIAELLEAAGYRTVESVCDEGDPDRLALRSRLSAQQVEDIQEGARKFLEEEWPAIGDAQDVLRVRLEAEEAQAREDARQRALEETLVAQAEAAVKASAEGAAAENGTAKDGSASDVSGGGVDGAPESTVGSPAESPSAGETA